MLELRIGTHHRHARGEERSERFVKMTTWLGRRKPSGAAESRLTGRACLDCGYIAMFAKDPSDLG